MTRLQSPPSTALNIAPAGGSLPDSYALVSLTTALRVPALTSPTESRAIKLPLVALNFSVSAPEMSQPSATPEPLPNLKSSNSDFLENMTMLPSLCWKTILQSLLPDINSWPRRSSPFPTILSGKVLCFVQKSGRAGFGNTHASVYLSNSPQVEPTLATFHEDRSLLKPSGTIEHAHRMIRHCEPVFQLAECPG